MKAPERKNALWFSRLPEKREAIPVKRTVLLFCVLLSLLFACAHAESPNLLGTLSPWAYSFPTQVEGYTFVSF